MTATKAVNNIQKCRVFSVRASALFGREPHDEKAPDECGWYRCGAAKDPSLSRGYSDRSDLARTRRDCGEGGCCRPTSECQRCVPKNVPLSGARHSSYTR